MAGVRYVILQDTTNGYNHCRLYRMAFQGNYAQVRAAYVQAPKGGIPYYEQFLNNLSPSVNPNQYDVFAANVSFFKIMANGLDQEYFSNQHQHQLPRYVDILLGLLSEEDARKAALMSGSAQDDFIKRNEKRFWRRVFLFYRSAIPAPGGV